MQCPNCGRDVEAPLGADACPQCAQWAKVARLQRSNAVIKSGVIGFAAGLVVLTVLMQTRDDLSPLWTALPLVTFAAGAILSVLRSRSTQRK